MSVYDSMAGTASATTQKTVRVLAGKHTRVKYVRTCTQQTKSGDCGCFALAYATTVVLGGSSFYIENLFLIFQYLIQPLFAVNIWPHALVLCNLCYIIHRVK